MLKRQLYGELFNLMGSKNFLSSGIYSHSLKAATGHLCVCVYVCVRVRPLENFWANTNIYVPI